MPPCNIYSDDKPDVGFPAFDFEFLGFGLLNFEYMSFVLGNIHLKFGVVRAAALLLLTFSLILSS